MLNVLAIAAIYSLIGLLFALLADRLKLGEFSPVVFMLWPWVLFHVVYGYIRDYDGWSAFFGAFLGALFFYVVASLILFFAPI